MFSGGHGSGSNSRRSVSARIIAPLAPHSAILKSLREFLPTR